MLAVRWSVKKIFVLNSLIFWIRLAEKLEEGEEEYRQLQRVIRFMQTQKKKKRKKCSHQKICKKTSLNPQNEAAIQLIMTYL